MHISSKTVMFWSCRWATRTFNSLQRFSMGLRSGDWLGHSRTLKCFLRSHSFVARAVCLGSLSCWKTQPRLIFNALADGRRFSLKISRYMAPFILSFTQISRPGPFAEKQPQSMMFPPPCFTVGMVFFGCNSAFFLLQTRQVEFLPKSYILVSSDHMTFSQSSSGSSKSVVSNPAPGELPSCRLQFQPCSNTPVCNYQVALHTLISWFRCVWLGLELKSAGW